MEEGFCRRDTCRSSEPLHLTLISIEAETRDKPVAEQPARPATEMRDQFCQEATGISSESKPYMRLRIGVADEEPTFGGASRDGLLAKLEDRTRQQIVLKRARTIEFGEEPVASRGTQPLCAGDDGVGTGP